MSNRVAMVTGGAQGIGKGIATTLAEQGFRVAVADLNLDVAEQTAKEITAAGGEAIAVEIDVTSTPSVEAAVATVEKELGPIEVVVNNAGWDDFMTFVQTTEEFWDKILDINFKGALRVIQTVRARAWSSAASAGSSTSARTPAGSAPRWRRSTRAPRAGSSPSPRRWRARSRPRASRPTPCAPVRRTPRHCGSSPTAPATTPDKVIAGMTRAVPMKRLGTPEDVGPAVALLRLRRRRFRHRSDAVGQRRPDDGLTDGGTEPADSMPA